ncbi:MAG: hypothetical protein HYS81_03995 [Candidatus Aenigmatarchaeota archaeon]|nr:MAG: hypothetical protein HYS81_03995 [Candidatus Aenigmarchaeota archaeon]
MIAMCFTKQQLWTVAAVIFGLVTLLHALRLANNWAAQIGPYVIPIWFSWIAVAVAAYLAYEFWKHSGEKPAKKGRK